MELILQESPGTERRLRPIQSSMRARMRLPLYVKSLGILGDAGRGPITRLGEAFPREVSGLRNRHENVC